MWVLMHLKLFSPSVTAYAVPPLTASSPLSYSRHLPALRGVTSSEGGNFFVQTAASTVFGVRVSGGHLCEAEAPTEVAAETVGRESASEGLLQT